METKQTAVEWFISETYHLGGTMIFNNGQRVFYLAIEQYEELLKQAKQMEKEQIKDAFTDGCIGELYELNAYYTSEKYYEETYGTKKQDSEA
jgi:hypothetical protein